MAKQYSVTVNGTVYDVTVEELGTAAAPAAVSAPTPAPAPVAAPGTRTGTCSSPKLLQQPAPEKRSTHLSTVLFLTLRFPVAQQ